MSLDSVPTHQDPPIQITIEYKQSKMVAVSTNSSLIDHFLRKVKMSQSENTWMDYAHDLKIFFAVLGLPLQHITRQSCVLFIEKQGQAGLSRFTINRRLAAVSSLFQELNLLDPEQYPRNPVNPVQRKREIRRLSQSLYRKQPERIPEIIAENDLQNFFARLPSWSEFVSQLDYKAHWYGGTPGQD